MRFVSNDPQARIQIYIRAYKLYHRVEFLYHNIIMQCQLLLYCMRMCTYLYGIYLKQPHYSFLFKHFFASPLFLFYTVSSSSLPSIYLKQQIFKLILGSVVLFNGNSVRLRTYTHIHIHTHTLQTQRQSHTIRMQTFLYYMDIRV